MQSFLYNLDNIHLFAWVVIMWAIAHCAETQRKEQLLNQTVIRTKPLFALMVFLPILLMTVYGRPRSDTYLYLLIYHNLPANFILGFHEAISAKEPGFALFQLFVNYLTGGNEFAFRLSMALIHIIPLILIFRRYSEDYLLSTYIFIAGGYHLAWMMNGMRQFMAVTIIFAATPWIVEKRYLRTILVILLATTFHRTALFMLPVIFIVQGDAWNFKTILFSMIAVAATFLFARNSLLFDEFADTVGYSMDAVREWGDDGSHPMRVLVTAVPMVLSFLVRDKIRTDNSGIINICTNMSVITTGLSLVAMVTSGIMMGRMTIYTSLYNLILLPYLIHEYFHEANGMLIKTLTVVFYFLYFVVLTGF